MFDSCLNVVLRAHGLIHTWGAIWMPPVRIPKFVVKIATWNSNPTANMYLNTNANLIIMLGTMVRLTMQPFPTHSQSISFDALLPTGDVLALCWHMGTQHYLVNLSICCPPLILELFSPTESPESKMTAVWKILQPACLTSIPLWKVQRFLILHIPKPSLTLTDATNAGLSDTSVHISSTVHWMN